MGSETYAYGDWVTDEMRKNAASALRGYSDGGGEAGAKSLLESGMTEETRAQATAVGVLVLLATEEIRNGKMSALDLMNFLADCIDPGENTCTMVHEEKMSGDELYPTEAYSCSECGCVTNEGVPFYCPNCGAEVTGRRYRYGDWVSYEPEGETPDTGRVVDDVGDACFVCFNHGCTAERTPKEHMRPATSYEIFRKGPRGVGFHRFDTECPEYDAECCGGCRHARKGEE